VVGTNEDEEVEEIPLPEEKLEVTMTEGKAEPVGAGCSPADGAEVKAHESLLAEAELGSIDNIVSLGATVDDGIAERE
jgi:hypothetical protein